MSAHHKQGIPTTTTKQNKTKNARYMVPHSATKELSDVALETETPSSSASTCAR